MFLDCNLDLVDLLMESNNRRARFLRDSRYVLIELRLDLNELSLHRSQFPSIVFLHSPPYFKPLFHVLHHLLQLVLLAIEELDLLLHLGSCTVLELLDVHDDGLLEGLLAHAHGLTHFAV